MAVRKQIYVWFFVGDPVFIYNPKIFNKYAIIEEKVMRVTMTNVGLSYIASNGYIFQDSDISESVFHCYEAAASKRKEVLNENTH